VNTYRWYFKINKTLLESFPFNFFAKIKDFLGNYRIEEEDYHGDIVIIFESNVPHVEGFDTIVNISIARLGESIFSFLPIEYPK